MKLTLHTQHIIIIYSSALGCGKRKRTAKEAQDVVFFIHISFTVFKEKHLFVN